MVLIERIELDRRVTQAHRDARYQRLQRARRGAGRVNVLLDEATREREKQANLTIDKKDRFRRLPLVGEIIGCTNENAPHLPGDIVYLLCDNNENYTYRDRRSVIISDVAISFKESFYFAQEREKVHRKREQSNALSYLEQREIISTAEAVIVARHKGAWRVALPNEFRPAAAVNILDNFNATYEIDISHEVVGHACASYGAYNNRFPPEFRAANLLDFFICDTTFNVLAGALADDADNVARFDQHIIQFADLALLQQLSPIAAKDTLPDHQRRVEQDDIVRVLDRLGYNVREELNLGFATQPNNPLPSDFNHMDE
ncbi:hypothetical protein KCU81_g3626, partial [Aureobasidium melanogenum]|uniref:Uncharacterized protein n=1 Tax=Aureobasidium melanogenum (strain CBS 110374) TaxID=1043003 RepID=A0A074WDE4_AURM1